MGSTPAPFADIGKKARDLLAKDYDFDQKFTVTVLSPTGMELAATGLKKDEFFFGHINTLYKSGSSVVDLKVDTFSNVTTKVSVNDLLPSAKASITFNLPDHQSGKYLHPHAAVNSSIGLNPAPLVELSATIGSKDLCLGGEVAFDTASAALTKYNAGIGLNQPDFSAALLLADKGKTLKASYVHSVNPTSSIAAEMSHQLSTHENRFTIGSAHVVDPFTVVKTRFVDDGKVAMLCQREWRPKSLITLSAEYDSKKINASPKLGLALALKP